MLDKATVRNALESLSWSRIEATLAAASLASGDIDALCTIVLESERLLFRHDWTLETAREAVFSNLVAYVAEKVDSEASQRVHEVLDLVVLCDDGYRLILDTLSRSLAGQLAPSQRVMIGLNYAAEAFDHVYHNLTAHYEVEPEIVAYQSVMRDPETGDVFSPDGAAESITSAVAAVIMMESHINKWFLEDGRIELPIEADRDVRDAAAAAVDQYLAICWREWREIEFRVRYQGGTVHIGDVESIRDLIPERFYGARVALTYAPSVDQLQEEMLLFCARERLRRRAITDLFTLEHQSGVQHRVRTWNTVTALAPQQYVGMEEVLGAFLLSSLLSFSIFDDRETYGDLTIVEWLRAFAVLRGLARDRYFDEHPNLLASFSEADLIDVFVNAGLSREAALFAIEGSTFGRRSRDIFDAPLLRVAQGRYILFGPALIAANLALIVCSVVHTRGILDKKGSWFEESVRAQFAGKTGIRVAAVRFGNAQNRYEYDALVEWGDYLFMMECKSRNLPSGDVLSERRFIADREDDLEQVRRLREGLSQHAERLREIFGVDIDQRTIIPVIVHSQPYMCPPSSDGIFFVDATTLQRFFESRYFRLIVPYKVGETTLLHRINFASQWTGDKPSPEDLVALLHAAPQVASVLEGIELRPIWFNLDESRIAGHDQFRLRPVTIDEDINALGGVADSVRADMSQMQVLVKELREKVLSERIDVSGAAEDQPS